MIPNSSPTVDASHAICPHHDNIRRFCDRASHGFGRGLPPAQDHYGSIIVLLHCFTFVLHLRIKISENPGLINKIYSYLVCFSSFVIVQFDMATSAIALFGVLSAKAKGEALPHGVAYGKDGQFTTDAAEALEGGGGAIATFGGHKGAGLALVVELLAGALSGSAVLGQVPSKRAAKSWGHTFVAIRPQALTDDYESKVSSVLAAVQASGDNIRIPGERSTRTAAERLETGILPIPARIWESILQTAEHGLPKPPLRVEDKLFQTIMKQQNQPKDDDDK